MKPADDSKYRNHVQLSRQVTSHPVCRRCVAIEYCLQLSSVGDWTCSSLETKFNNEGLYLHGVGVTCRKLLLNLHRTMLRTSRSIECERLLLDLGYNILCHEKPVLAILYKGHGGWGGGLQTKSLLAVWAAG